MSMVTRLLAAPTRWLHPLRRRSAREALRARAPRSILVVCHGNICRSPFAAALLEQALGPVGIGVHSAGFLGPGRPSPHEAVAVAARRSVDLSRHRSRLLTADLVGSADLIVVMDAAQRRQVCDRFGRAPRDVILLGDLDPAPIETRPIRDPVDQGAEVFEASYARIERCAGELAQTLIPQQGARLT
jgi:protein-tyrosine-phosphatase